MFLAHDSTLSIAYPKESKVVVIKCPCLPFSQVLFLSETELVTGGYDGFPFLFSNFQPFTW
jgi:hypothetical protein